MRCFDVDLKEVYPFLAKESTRAVLTCYLPDNSAEVDLNRKHPVILILPGGGYCFVSFREAEPLALPFLAKGFAAFVLDYSVAPAAHYPVQLREAAAAMHYIRSHAEEYFLVPDQVAVIGGSAGGHLTASIANLWSEPFLAKEFGCDSWFLRPDLHLLNYPVITAAKGLCHEGSFQALAGHEEVTDEERAFFSMENHVSAETPKAFIWHTAEDGCVPVESALLYCEALSAHKVPFELHIYPYGGHGLSVANYTTAPGLQPAYIQPYVAGWMDHALAWLAMEFDLKY